LSEDVSIIEEDDGEAERGAELIGTIVAGRYRLERLLGAGGMGSVYRGEHVHMKKPVAVKVLHREMTALPEMVARFEREAVAAGRIEHPNVVTASDFGRLDDGSFFLVLEFVEGTPLAKVLDKEHVLPPERALHITRQIADALGAAHALRIVHRDLKPDNIMLVDRENYRDFVKVLDFGIAKVRMQDETGKTQQLTQLGTVFGTPEYMSPEQARGNPVDGRGDLYALGVMLYEMLAGKTPFKADDLIVVLTRHITEPPPPLSEKIPGPVRELVMKLLAKSPDERYQSAPELVLEIDRMIGPSAPPPSSLLKPRGGSTPDTQVALDPPAPSSAVRPIAPTAVANTLDDAPRPVVPSGPSALSKLMASPWLHRQVLIGPKQLPVWTLLAGAVGLVFIGALTTFALASDGTRPTAGATGTASVQAPVEEVDKERMALAQKAEKGDPTAIADLEARSKNDRTAEEWRAIGHGYCQIGQLTTCVEKYRDGVTRRVSLAKDEVVLADVHRAALSLDSHRPALELAALHLWAPGVDIIYDVMTETKSSKELADVNKRAKEFLEDGAIRGKASPALKPTLDLQRAMKKRDCGSVKKLVSAVGETGDVRAVQSLEQLRASSGCGLLGLGDCWSCLRGVVNVGDALDAVKARPAPTFEG